MYDCSVVLHRIPPSPPEKKKNVQGAIQNHRHAVDCFAILDCES